MGYKSTTSMRRLPRAVTSPAAKKHGLSSADIKLSDARAGSTRSNKNKEPLLTTKRQLRNALASAQRENPLDTAAKECHDSKAATARSTRKKEISLTTKRQLQNALALVQTTCPLIAKTSKFKKPKPTDRAEATKSGHRSGQRKFDRSSKVEADRVVTSNANHNVQASALYIIRESPGKGFGMFAAKDFPKGTRILADKPFFSLTKRPVISVSDPYAANDISKAYDGLSLSDQVQYLCLHCPERPGVSRGISIYEANCYEMRSGTCICLDASRINHSCVPNAHFAWNQSIERETVHAVRDISKDEEITISYCSAFRTLEERERELEPYVFACNCAACQSDTKFGIESNIRRQQMRDLDEQIADYRNDPLAARMKYHDCDEESAILRLINLIHEEGLVHEKSLAYHDAADCALKRGSMEEALKYATKELDIVFQCVGRDSPYYDETITFIQEICFEAKSVAN